MANEIDNNDDWARLEKVLHRISVLSEGARKMSNSQLVKVCTDKK